MKTFFFSALFCISVCLNAQQNFDIKILRQSSSNNLVTGKLYINEQYIGETYENDGLKISEGKYPGFLRYISQSGHVTGPLGNIGKVGDFLLEVGNVKWTDGKTRSNILFHGGNKPQHSKGCIMLGAVPRDTNGNRYLPDNHTLSKVRKKFYETDNPNSSPNKKITIEIVEIFFFNGKWSAKEGGDAVQLEISRTGSDVRIKYSFIWEDGDIDSYNCSNVKLINSSKITFNIKQDGETYKCELNLSADKKYVNWKAIDPSGESGTVRLKKN